MLFLAPTGPYFDRVLQNPVSVKNWEQKPAELPDQIRVWGFKPGNLNKRNWERMSNGDLVLFYRMGKGTYVAHGKVNFTDETEYFYENVWPDRSIRKIYILEDFNNSLRLSYSEFNSMMGFASDFRPTTHWYVSDRRNWRARLSNVVDIE